MTVGLRIDHSGCPGSTNAAIGSVAATSSALLPHIGPPCLASPPSKWRRATRSWAERSSSTPTRTRTRSTSASASTTTTTASCRCSSACSQPSSEMAEDAAAARLPADRRHRRLRQRRCRSLVFGADSAAVKDGRVATVQALGGTGGLKVGADFLQRGQPRRRGADQRPELGKPPRAVRSTPASWSRPIPTTTPRTHGVDFDGMLAALNALPAGTIVVLHACCHNPTGCDLTPEQWDRGDRGRQARAAWCRSSTWPTRASATASTQTARRCASSPPPASTVFVSTSFSKSLLALRRARRRAERGLPAARKKRRAC